MIVITGSRILLTAHLLYLLLRGRLATAGLVALALALTVVPQAASRWLGVDFGRRLSGLFVVFIMAAQWLGTALRAYDYLWWWDLALHAFSGVLVASLSVPVLRAIDRDGVLWRERMYGVITMVMFLGACTSAVLWEVWEFLGDTFVGTNAQHGEADTMTDMIACVVSAAIYCRITYRSAVEGRDNAVMRMVGEITRTAPRVSSC